MKRTIEFKLQDDSYFLEENGTRVFAIKVSDLKFNSLDFYSGVYKNKSANIELVNQIELDPHKKGDYIFAWLSEIVLALKKEFKEDETVIEEANSERIIPLFEFAVCAGDGFFLDESVPHSDVKDTTGIADFAVTIAGDSMEPTIKNHSVVFVKKEEIPMHKDVGLFVVNGDIMCKRYIKKGRGYTLSADNIKYNDIQGREIESISFLGRVILE
ncbi:MAG: S24 family peptidase [Clostridia bacterium]|nr:S24 family peptidase [Clostridia bacterium]